MQPPGEDPLVPFDKCVQSFIAWYGEIPRQAVRLEESKARERAARWLPERFGNDSASDCHVIALELDARWWVLMFQRAPAAAPDHAENWWIEAYGHDGTSWASNCFYWPSEDYWRHFLHAFRGENYGRHRR